MNAIAKRQCHNEKKEKKRETQFTWINSDAKFLDKN